MKRRVFAQMLAALVLISMLLAGCGSTPQDSGSGAGA